MVHQPADFAGVNIWAWQHYHERRRGIEAEYCGRWGDPDAITDDCLRAAIDAAHADLRREMRMLATTSGGVYPVPIYD